MFGSSRPHGQQTGAGLLGPKPDVIALLTSDQLRAVTATMQTSDAEFRDGGRECLRVSAAPRGGLALVSDCLGRVGLGSLWDTFLFSLD